MSRSSAGDRVLLPLPSDPGDLVWARDAVLSWMVARHREGSVYYLAPDPGRLAELRWLGLDWEDLPADDPVPGSKPEGAVTLEDELQGRLEVPLAPVDWTLVARTVAADRRAGATLRVRSAADLPLSAAEAAVHRCLGSEPPRFLHLAPVRGSAGWSVPDLRERGFIAEGVLSYLGELGWSDPAGRRFLTRPELSLRFAPEGLAREPVEHDPSRLEEAHQRFLSELTHSELLARSVPFLRRRGFLGEGPLERHREMELEALSLLYGEQVHTLAHFPEVVSFYFRDPGAPGEVDLRPLAERLEAVEEWDSVLLEEVLADLDEDARTAVETVVTGSSPTPGLAEVMALVGREATLRRLARSGGTGRASWNPAPR